MDIINWLPSVTATSLLALVLWLGRKLIETRLTNSVKHEFDTKLEEVRAEFREKEELLKADLRSKEIEIAAIRSGAMTAMASRQMALDKRRLEAADQLWSAVSSLAPAKAISSAMGSVKFEEMAKAASESTAIREAFAKIGAGIDQEMDVSGSEKARPFVSPMTWALFAAYQAIAMRSVEKMKIIKSGGGSHLLKENTDVIWKLVKAAVPHQEAYEAYIDKFGDTGYHYLLDEIEGRLLEEMHKTLTGLEADKASLEQAAVILALSNDLLTSANQSSIPFEGMPGRARL